MPQEHDAMIRAEVRALVHRIEDEDAHLARRRPALLDLIEPTAVLHPDLSAAMRTLLSAVDRFSELAKGCDVVFEANVAERRLRNRQSESTDPKRD